MNTTHKLVMAVALLAVVVPALAGCQEASDRVKDEANMVAATAIDQAASKAATAVMEKAATIAAGVEATAAAITSTLGVTSTGLITTTDVLTPAVEAGRVLVADLVSGTLCSQIGGDLAVDGKTVRFACKTASQGLGETVLLGDIVPTDAGWTIEQALMSVDVTGRYSTAGNAMVPITGILLDGDTACRAVDAGAALALDGRRAAFDCGELAGARSVLLGELSLADAGWTIEKALVQQAPTGEWTILTSETATAIAVYVGEPTG